MESSIEVLSDETINQIAAGEVVEGPASCVKELVENALDAKAGSIRVQLVGGGLQSIIVTDDGEGMSRKDAELSIVRHATSKIRKARDLFHIASMGFRGEALASIASISKMTIETSQAEAGVCLEVERGEIISIKARARTQGTTLIIRELFHNVPARKKFQKGAPALAAEVLRVITALALGHPSVHFELISSGKKTLSTRRGDTLSERVEGVLGSRFSQGAVPLEFRQGELHFHGLIGLPHMSRPNRMAQYLFLNRRAVTCEAIADAVRKGYGTRLEQRRHPLFLLQLGAPTELIDVNVHPQKLHVRLRKEELFRQTVCQAVEEALGGKQPQVAAPVFEAPAVNFAQVPLLCREEPHFEEEGLAIEPEPIEILRIFDRYIFCVDAEGPSLVDAKAASFRIRFEEVLANMGCAPSKQGLLIPLTLDVTPIESAMILTHRAAIEEVGFTLKPIGQEVIMVEAIAPCLSEAQVAVVLSEMAQILQSFIGKVDYETERRQALALVIARCASASGVCSTEEAQRLLERLSRCESPSHCPKGELVRIPLNVETLQYLFKAHPASSRVSK